MTTADIPAETVTSDDEWALVYDWQCPACNLYCRLLCIGEAGAASLAALGIAGAAMLFIGIAPGYILEFSKIAVGPLTP